MPHGTRTVGQVEITSLCDGVVISSRTTARDGFPDGSDETWSEARERYPDVFEGERWRFHVHCSVLRSASRTVLVDTGVGPASAPAFGWSATPGALDRELEAIGVAPAEVDAVVITHVHDDHLGWNVDEASGDPAFPNARYLLHRADREWLAASGDEEDRALLEATIAPLEDRGVLDLVEDALELTPELLIRHAPGHTPGHQIVLVDSAGERAIVWGDIANIPAQLLQPGLNGVTDNDPVLAARTRASILELVDRDERLVIPSHFPQGFGTLAREGERRIWIPAPS